MEVKSKVVLLYGENYATWKVQVKMVLIKDDLWRIVSGDEVAPTDAGQLAKFNIRKDKALATIVLAVDPKLLYIIGDPTCPSEIWKKLKDTFQRKTWSNKLRLRKKLYAMKLTEDGELQEHLKVLTELFDELAVTGAAIEDEDKTIHLLASLPEKFDTIVTTLEAFDTVPAWEAVTERLLREEEKKGSGRGSGEKAFYSSRKPYYKNKLQCFQCQLYGHIKRNFPTLNNKEVTSYAARKEEHVDDEIVLATTPACTANNLRDGFLLDSACTRHMAHDRSLFCSLKDTVQKNVLVGDGKRLEVHGQGEIILDVISTEGNIKKCRLQNVLYVPHLTHNLLSVSKISADGKNVIFSKNVCKIMDGNKTLAFGMKHEDLYVLAQAQKYPSYPRKETVFYDAANWRKKENSADPAVALTAVILQEEHRHQQSGRMKISCRYDGCKHFSCK